jgi:hypothetical protein
MSPGLEEGEKNYGRSLRTSLLGQGSGLGAQARFDVIGDGGDLDVRIGVAERRHHDHTMRRLAHLLEMTIWAKFVARRHRPRGCG